MTQVSLNCTQSGCRVSLGRFSLSGEDDFICLHPVQKERVEAFNRILVWIISTRQAKPKRITCWFLMVTVVTPRFFFFLTHLPRKMRLSVVERHSCPLRPWIKTTIADVSGSRGLPDFQPGGTRQVSNTHHGLLEGGWFNPRKHTNSAQGPEHQEAIWGAAMM